MGFEKGNSTPGILLGYQRNIKKLVDLPDDDVFWFECYEKIDEMNQMDEAVFPAGLDDISVREIPVRVQTGNMSCSAPYITTLIKKVVMAYEEAKRGRLGDGFRRNTGNTFEEKAP